MKWTLNYSIQDGTLSRDTGRLIFYKNCMMKSIGPSMDHNDLCFAFARRYRFSSSEVRSKASRYYYRQSRKDFLTVSPVRKIDGIDVQNNQRVFDMLIQETFR